MAVKEVISAKKRVIRRIERMEEDKVQALEAQLDVFEKPSAEEIERRLEAWRGIFGLLSDPDDYAEFEKYARRRSLFGGRTLNLEQDSRDKIPDEH